MKEFLADFGKKFRRYRRAATRITVRQGALAGALPSAAGQLIELEDQLHLANRLLQLPGDSLDLESLSRQAQDFLVIGITLHGFGPGHQLLGTFLEVCELSAHRPGFGQARIQFCGNLLDQFVPLRQIRLKI